MKQEKYALEEGKITIVDPELEISIQVPFSPLMLPNNPTDGMQLDDHVIRTVYRMDRTPEEFYLEQNGVPDGQSVLYHPNGKVKMEAFYLKGQLHGPTTVLSEAGILLAKSWFVEGKQQGKSLWHYLSGRLYSIQRYRDGALHGKQEYYYEDGKVKSLIYYSEGLLDGEVILYKEDGAIERQLRYAKGIGQD